MGDGIEGGVRWEIDAVGNKSAVGDLSKGKRGRQAGEARGEGGERTVGGGERDRAVCGEVV